MRPRFGPPEFVRWLDSQRLPQNRNDEQTKIRLSTEARNVLRWVTQQWELKQENDALYLLFLAGRAFETETRRSVDRPTVEIDTKSESFLMRVNESDAAYLRNIPTGDLPHSIINAATQCIAFAVQSVRGIDHADPAAPWWWSTLPRYPTKKTIRDYYFETHGENVDAPGRPRDHGFVRSNFSDDQLARLPDKQSEAFARSTTGRALERDAARKARTASRRTTNAAAQRRHRLKKRKEAKGQFPVPRKPGSV